MYLCRGSHYPLTVKEATFIVCPTCRGGQSSWQKVQLNRKEPESALSWWLAGTAPLKLSCAAQLGCFQSWSPLFCQIP